MPTAVKGTAAANLLLTALHCIGEVFWAKKRAMLFEAHSEGEGRPVDQLISPHWFGASFEVDIDGLLHRSK